MPGGVPSPENVPPAIEDPEHLTELLGAASAEASGEMDERYRLAVRRS